MSRMSGAKALIEALRRERVEVIFGLPGGAIMPTYDELYGSDLRHILVRHEQSAAHMAEGYARASGRVGVCMATSGPGATNLVTGITNAFLDSSPIVAFTGQVARPMIGKDGFQEADIVGIATPVTKYNFQVWDPREIPSIVKTSFFIASTGRPGPVLVDLPRDVQIEEAEMDFPERVEVRGYLPNGDPSSADVEKAGNLLARAERPFIVAGGGIAMTNAYHELLTLAELLLAPVATSLMGKGCFPENHPLSVGLLGMHGTREANRLVMEADVVLAIGMRFSDRTTGRAADFCPDAHIIHIDIDSAEMGKNKRVEVPIVADARKTLAAVHSLIEKRLAKKRESTWVKRVHEVRKELQGQLENDEKAFSPPNILRKLRQILPSNAIVTTEVGQNQMWSALYFKAYEPRTFISSGGLGTMGFGFPASIGAKVARPDVPVVDIAGDGSFMMTENCLATSVMERIPVTVVILNNRMLGMVAQWQRIFYERRYSGTQLGTIPDFTKLAEAYHAQGIRAESIDEFAAAAKKAITSDVTTVIDVPISSEENVIPMVKPGGSLSESLELA